MPGAMAPHELYCLLTAVYIIEVGSVIIKQYIYNYACFVSQLLSEQLAPISTWVASCIRILCLYPVIYKNV